MFTLAVILCAIAVILVVILLIVMFIVSGKTMIYFDIKMKSKPGYKSRQRFNKKCRNNNAGIIIIGNMTTGEIA